MHTLRCHRIVDKMLYTGMIDGHTRYKTSPPDAEFVYGMRDIAKYIGFSVSTVRRWRDKHGFPICTAPNGQLMMSKTLAVEWVKVRASVQRRERRLLKEAHGSTPH